MKIKISIINIVSTLVKIIKSQKSPGHAFVAPSISPGRAWRLYINAINDFSPNLEVVAQNLGLPGLFEVSDIFWREIHFCDA